MGSIVRECAGWWRRDAQQRAHGCETTQTQRMVRAGVAEVKGRGDSKRLGHLQPGTSGDTSSGGRRATRTGGVARRTARPPDRGGAPVCDGLVMLNRGTSATGRRRASGGVWPTPSGLLLAAELTARPVAL
jgi:hypothetical protein